MKIQNKRELQNIAISHTADVDFKGIWKIYRKCTKKHDLDREPAKISALSSGELKKYKYLTGDNLGYKPDVIQKAKFEYSQLGKVFNKRLNESDKKEGLLRRLKNIESKNKEQLNEIEYQGEKQLDTIEKQVKRHLEAINKQE